MVTPTTVATAMVLIGTAASLLGSELALRVGQRTLITLAFVLCSGIASVTGFLGANVYAFAIVLVLLYGGLVYLDSAALTAGTSASADPERRGMTLAVHSTLGYAGGFVGPLLFGVVLDQFKGSSQHPWGYAFLMLGALNVIGLLLFWLILPRAPKARPSLPFNDNARGSTPSTAARSIRPSKVWFRSD